MKIVIVEDNDSLRESIKNVLEHEGHTVKEFADGRSAYTFLAVEKDAVDLAIVDYMLPELDGVALIKELRQIGVVTPILMLTAKSDTKDKVTGLKSGADYYLTKPFEFAELMACVEALHRRPNNFQAEKINVCDNVVFDSDQKQIIKDGQEILLTPAEAGILLYLIRRRGKTCTEYEIFEGVFDFAKENRSNTVEVHIKNLRKKLKHKDYENPIKTIRGAGYLLV